MINPEVRPDRGNVHTRRKLKTDVRCTQTKAILSDISPTVSSVGRAPEPIRHRKSFDSGQLNS